MSEPFYHNIRIESPRGMSALTRVFLDGAEMRGVTFVSFATSPDIRGISEVTLRLVADVQVIGEPAIVKEWRNLRPSLWVRLWERRPWRRKNRLKLR